MQNNSGLINFDSFSHGQVGSKLWLCEELEKLNLKNSMPPLSISIYGSWVGLLPFLLLSRQRLKIRKFDLYDIDPEAHKIASEILDYWDVEREIKISYLLKDCNSAVLENQEGAVVVNTSCEHFENLKWWNNISKGMIFCLQSTDMKHPTHVGSPESLAGWIKSLGLRENDLDYAGEKYFSYDDFHFHRWMLIGKKS